MKEQHIQENDSSYKLIIEILADLLKEHRETYKPSSDNQKDEAPESN